MISYSTRLITPPTVAPMMAPIKKDQRQRHGDIAQFAVDHAAHDGLGENVKQVGADGQDAFDAGTHQGRGDDEAAAGADAAGDQTGAHADEDRDDEDARAVKGRAVGFLAAQNIGQCPADLLRKGEAAENTGRISRPRMNSRLRSRRMVLALRISHSANRCAP